MNRVIAILSLSLACNMVWAGEKVDRTLDAAPDGYVKIEHLSGYVKVEGWSKNQVQVVGELDDRAEELIFKRKGDQIKIEVELPKRRSWNNHGKGDGDKLKIFVPEKSRVNYESVNADFEGEGFSGGAELDTVNGEIEVRNLAGRLRIESVNGDIKAKNLKGDIRLETVNGDIRDVDSEGKKIWYDTVNGDIKASNNHQEIAVEVVNGDIELELQKVSELHLSTVNGSVEASLELLEGGEVKASSVGGTVELMFQDDVSARFDIEAHAGGRLVNKLTNDDVRKDKYGPGRWLEFATNNGNGTVKVSTVHGKVILKEK